MADILFNQSMHTGIYTTLQLSNITEMTFEKIPQTIHR